MSFRYNTQAYYTQFLVGEMGIICDSKLLALKLPYRRMQMTICIKVTFPLPRRGEEWHTCMIARCRRASSIRAYIDRCCPGLYFSAHWCPPCRVFTPQLVGFYEDLKEQNDSQFEVVFVSSDRDRDSWQKYFNDMPWLALPFEDRDRKVLSYSRYIADLE